MSKYNDILYKNSIALVPVLLTQYAMAENLVLASPDELKELREWLSKIPYIPIDYCDDDTLQRFYLHRKGSLADTKENIIRFFKNYMVLSKDLCILDMDHEDAKAFSKISHDVILPKKAKDGSTVIYQYIIPPFVKNVTLQNIVEHRRKMWNILWGLSPTQLKFTLVYSAKDHTLGLLLQHFNLEQFAKYISSAIKTLPFSVVAIHVIHVSPLWDAFSKKFMLILSEKIRNRVTFHSNLDTLYEFIDKDCLPSDLGGTLPPCQELHDSQKKNNYELFNDRLLKLQEFFLENHGKYDDLLGDELDTATFRRLDID